MSCVAGGFQCLADDADAAVHHVGGREDVCAGFGLHERLLDEGRVGFVIQDDAVAHQAVVAVTGVGVERHVENDADVEACRLDGARRPADDVVAVEGLAGVIGLEVVRCAGKQGDGRDAEVHGFFRSGNDEVDAQTLNTGHRGNVFDAVFAWQHE